MAKSQLFEYAVLYHPKPKKDANGNEVAEPSKLITDVQRVLAASADHVSIQAARSIPDTYLNELENVEIVVRNF